MTTERRVLVVDDDEDIREGVCRWLGARGFATSVARDGEEGVASATQVPPHAILLDVLMPKKGGMEALDELRSNESTAKIPVIMLSASLRDEQRALDAGASYFVHKPYNGNKLVSTVTAAIEQCGSNAVTYCDAS